MRIYERIEVIDEHGDVVRTFTREMDPSRYWIGPDIRDAEWIQRTRRMTAEEARAAESNPSPQTGPGTDEESNSHA